MAWRKSSNSDSVKPAAIDKESSRKVVFVRKDFKEAPSYDQDGAETGAHWEYMENKIPKEDWEAYETAYNAQDASEQNRADIAYIAMMADIEL